TQKSVPPGETFVYEFTLHQVGTYMYHTGFNMMKQDGMGLGGFLVIHPKGYRHKIKKRCPRTHRKGHPMGTVRKGSWRNSEGGGRTSGERVDP
ncbi:MAG: multicopper oxidase domain-containing protein, partial [Deltaproteobacteria bacterium]|nr:multicopper oxidase domain-containing protein [Deltaproteobacteria bacterium]